MKTNNLIVLSCVEIDCVVGGVSAKAWMQARADLTKLAITSAVAKPLDYFVYTMLPRLDDNTWTGWAWNGCAKGISFFISMVPVTLIFISMAHQKTD